MATPARSDLDRPALLLSKLGSFWSDVYEDRDFVRLLVEAAAATFRDAEAGLADALACESLDTVPPFAVRRWHRLAVTKAELYNTGVAARLDDDGLGVLDAASPAVLDAPAPPRYEAAVPGLYAAPSVTNRLADPSVAWHQGTDYAVRDGVIRFDRDPFAAGLFETEPVGDDEVVYLWLWRPQFDLRRVWLHYGYVFGLQGRSGARYLEAVRTLWRATTGGSSLLDTARAFEAMTGVPLAEGGETVEEVSADPRGTLVVTDRSALRYPAGTTARVAAGDVLGPLESGVAEAGLYELRRGDVPAGLPAIVLEAGWFRGGVEGGVLFENRDLPLSVAGTAATFPVGGPEADVAAFWAEVRAREADGAPTLLSLIEDLYGYAPDEVNPARVVAWTSLRRAAVGFSSVAAPAVPADRLVRGVVPPHAALLLVSQLPAVDDSAMFGSDEAGSLDDAVPALDDSAQGGETDGPVYINNQGSVCP